MKQKQHVIALAVLVLLVTLAVAALVGCDKTVEITFDPGNGASPTTVTLTAGEVLTAPQDPVREGYTFLGWFLGGEKYTFGAVSENMTLEARWEIDTYTVTFDTAGGTAVSPETVAHGGTATAPSDVTREGYYFVGWYLGDEEYDFTTPVTEDLTLVARWEINTYRVSFDTAGGTSAAPETVAHGARAQAPTGVTREGYHLVGWYLGDGKYDFSTPVTGDLTLVARWEINTYRVSFDTAGGTAVSPETVAHGGTATAPEGVTREGYDFLGWYVGNAEYDFTTPVTGDITITAKWQIKTFTVRFVKADGTTLTTETVEWGKSATAPEPPAAEEGFLFFGWDKAFDCVKSDLTVTAVYTSKLTVTFVGETGGTLALRYVAKGKTVAAPDDITREGYHLLGWYVGETAYDFSATVEDHLTLTVKWEINRYRVTFDTTGGDARDPQTVDWNTAATKPEDPTRTYYRFGGWLLNGEAYDFTTPVTGDITLKANWIIINYKVIFDSNGGTLVPDVLNNAGKPVEKPANPTRTGYRFGGWLTDEGALWDFATIITGDVKLTAQWFDKTEAPEPTVTGIYLDPGTVEMWEGMALKLAMAPMAVSDVDGAFTKLTAAGITMRFEALDPDVATVTSDGTVTAVSIGETQVYAVFETGGTINNGKTDVTIKAGDVSNAVTIRVVDKPAYLKAYENDPENQKITLGEVKGKDVNQYKSYPTGAYGAANIATWYGNAGTVFTLTADDNLLGDFAQWLAWFEAYSIPTTLCAPTGYAYECTDMWREMVAKGMDVQSHSRFHRSAGDYNSGKTSSAQDWMDFYGGSQDIASAGIRSLIIAYPCGYNTPELSKLLHIGGRGTGGYVNGFNLDYNCLASFSGLNEKQFAQLLDMAESGNGGWVSTHYHQIGSSKDNLDSMLARLVPYMQAGKLWSTTFAKASQYGQERDTASLTMGVTGRDLITFTLTDRMNDLLFDQALTIKIKVDSTWSGVRAYQNGQEMPARVVTDGGETYLFVDAIPDRGEVSVVRTEYQDQTIGTDRIAFTPTDTGDGYDTKVMTRRFFVTGDAWKHAYAVQGGKRIKAVVGNIGPDAYVDVTFTVGGGEVIVVPTTDQFDDASTLSMTDIYHGAVAPAGDKTITISTAEELRLFARWVNNNNDTTGLTFVLTDDIDLTGVDMEPIGWYVVCNKSSTLRFDRSFRGTFDGQGHTVSNLTINHNGCSTGFFGSTDGAVIKNVKIKNAYVFGMRQTGGLVGRLVSSTLNNCTFSGEVCSRGKGAEQYSGTFVGGLVGEMSGSQILNCAAEAEILVFGAANRSEDHFGSIYENKYTPYCNGSYVGGIVGRTSGATSTVKNVNFNGKVTVVGDGNDNGNAVGGFIGGGTFANITDCSSTAEVSGNERVGGFIGSQEGTNQSLNIRNCVANGSVYGNDKVGGFAGYMGYNGRASTKNSFANVRVSAAEGATFVGAVIGQAVAGPQTPNVEKVYYLPSLNPGMATHTPYKDGTVEVRVNILEAADVNAAFTALNALAAAAKDQTWIASGDTITPVHYPIFRVVFVDKDGGELAAHDVPNGMGVTAPEAPEYLGFRFVGWSADTSSVTGDMVVTAQYETVAVRTVIFRDKDGNEISRISVNDGESVTPPTAPVYEGFRFTGWSADTSSVTSDMDVTAQYEVVIVHEVTFVERDGVTPIGETQRINDGAAATAPEAPALEGYVFIGWSVDFSEVHGNLTVVAQYAKLYTVRFYGYNGVLLATVIVQDGKAATAPTAPAVDGYRFTGWAEDFSHVTSDLDVHANYAVKSTDPVTVEIKHVSAAGKFIKNLSKYLDGDIVVYDYQKWTAANVPADILAGWGFVSEQGMSGTNTGGGYGIFYNLERYELATGMTPYTLCGAKEFNGKGPYQENYKIISSFGNGFQVLAVPLFDKVAQRVVIMTFIFQGPWIGTSEANLTKLFKVTCEELTAFYPGADMFITTMHCVTNDKSGGHTGLTDRLSGLDDTTPFVDGWDMTCLNGIAQADGASTFYTLVYTTTGETGAVTVDAASVEAENNVQNGGYTVTVRVGKKEE